MFTHPTLPLSFFLFLVHTTGLMRERRRIVQLSGGQGPGQEQHRGHDYYDPTRPLRVVAHMRLGDQSEFRCGAGEGEGEKVLGDWLAAGM